MFLHSPHHITTLLEQQLLQNIQLLHSPHHITTLLEQQLLQNVQLLHEQRDSRVFTSCPLPPRTLSQAAATSLVIPLLLPRHLRPMTTTFPFCQPTPLPPRPIHLQELNFTAYFLFHCSFLLAPLPRIRPTGADVLEGNLIE